MSLPPTPESGLLPPYPDVELVVMVLLTPIAATYTGLPEQLDPPQVQVERIGGRDDGITDRPLVRTTFIGDDRTHAWRLARLGQQRLLAAAGQMVTGPELADEYPSGVLVDAVRTTTPPRQIAELGRDQRMVETVHEIHLRRPWW